MTLLPARFAGRAALGPLEAQAQLETHREQEKPLDGHGAFGLQPFELSGQRAERHPTYADVLGLLELLRGVLVGRAVEVDVHNYQLH